MYPDPVVSCGAVYHAVHATEVDLSLLTFASLEEIHSKESS